MQQAIKILLGCVLRLFIKSCPSVHHNSFQTVFSLFSAFTQTTQVKPKLRASLIMSCQLGDLLASTVTRLGKLAAKQIAVQAVDPDGAIISYQGLFQDATKLASTITMLMVGSCSICWLTLLGSDL